MLLSRSTVVKTFWICLILLVSLSYTLPVLTNETVVVKVTGMGKDIEAASQDAARLALSEVSGSLLQSSKSIVVSKDAFTPLIRNVKSNIRDYGSGVISSFSINEISRIGTLTAVTADVGVRLVEFRGYLTAIAQAEAEIPEDLSVRQSVEQRQDTNITSLLQNRIARPILTGEGLEFAISTPRLLSDVPELENAVLSQHGETSVSALTGFTIDTRKAFVFRLTITLKNDFKKVVLDTLKQSASIVNDISLNNFRSYQPLSYSTPTFMSLDLSSLPRTVAESMDQDTSGGNLKIFFTDTSSLKAHFFVYKNLQARLGERSLVHPMSWCPDHGGEKFRKVGGIRFPTLELKATDDNGRPIAKFKFTQNIHPHGNQTGNYWSSHSGQGKAIIVGWSTGRESGGVVMGLSENHPPWIPFGPAEERCNGGSYDYLYISDIRELLIVWEPPTGLLSKSSKIEATLGQ